MKLLSSPIIPSHNNNSGGIKRSLSGYGVLVNTGVYRETGRTRGLSSGCVPDENRMTHRFSMSSCAQLATVLLVAACGLVSAAWAQGSAEDVHVTPRVEQPQTKN